MLPNILGRFSQKSMLTVKMDSMCSKAFAGISKYFLLKNN